MQIKLYNTMSRKIEEFKPLVPGQVSFYSCGPTVYHYAHIGNLRQFVLADLLKRMFLSNGYKVKNVMNITDVGHLTSDNDDSGEDKMEKGAARENKSVWDIAKFYTDEFLRDINDLNILLPTYMPRATDYIAEQIELIQKLQDLGYTYEIANDGIYYDTSKFEDYGALTGGSTDGNRAGARIEFNTEKKNISDFALWKFSPKDKQRAMEWDSPWGRGFPGWHIECSAMSMALLGPHFDIHTGGTDLSRIHHANEIAQSEPIAGKPWVNYWVHGEFLIEKLGTKMSKSSGEFLTLSVLKERGYDPMAYKYLLLMGHYQSQLMFSWESLDAAATGYKNLVKKIAVIITDANKQMTKTTASDVWRGKMLSAVSDNLKTATVIVDFQEMLKDDNLSAAEKLGLIHFIDDLLGLQFIDRAEKLLAEEAEPIPAEVQKLADERATAKMAKNWELADKIRAQVENMGWLIQDSKEGVKIVKK
ncbi:MAG: cysteine--tRNA ligase [Alphaproteobacteria bacterium]|jgi:cysteinyl-tRNA synthetase|nr:cysteine--tRNA ligase [Alphaproteobacteria bacterium]